MSMNKTGYAKSFATDHDFDVVTVLLSNHVLVVVSEGMVRGQLSTAHHLGPVPHKCRMGV